MTQSDEMGRTASQEDRISPEPQSYASELVT